MDAGTDVHRDSAQLRDGVGLREAELSIVGVDERDVERIVLRRGVGRWKRPGNGWTTQIQKRGTVMLDAVTVGVAVCEDRRPVVGRDAVDRRIRRVGVIAVVGRRRRCIILAWELGWRGWDLVVTRKLRWGSACTGIRVIFAGQLRWRGLRRDRNPIGDEILRVDEPVIVVSIGQTRGGRRSMTVAAGMRIKKRTVRREAIGAIEPGAEAVLMIVAAVALRQEAVLDAVDRMGAREHVTVGRIEKVGEAVDVMMPAGF